MSRCRTDRQSNEDRRRQDDGLRPPQRTDDTYSICLRVPNQSRGMRYRITFPMVRNRRLARPKNALIQSPQPVSHAPAPPLLAPVRGNGTYMVRLSGGIPAPPKRAGENNFPP